MKHSYKENNRNLLQFIMEDLNTGHLVSGWKVGRPNSVEELMLPC